MWKSDEKEYFNITKTVYDLLRDRFPVKVFPVIGNHEAVPPNLFSTEEGSSPALRKTPELYANLASFWSPWLGEEQFETVRRAAIVDMNHHHREDFMSCFDGALPPRARYWRNFC